jgi:hypothetical protein
MKRKTIITCAVVAFALAGPAGADDCYKQIMNSLCTGPGTTYNWGEQCKTWIDKGYTCSAGPFLEPNVTSYLPDPARLSTSFTLIARGCREYKVCLKTSQPVQTCWGKEGTDLNTFISGSCPQG